MAISSSGWWMCSSSGGSISPIEYLNIRSVDIRKPKRFIKHPIETGTVIVDHVVADPWEATVHGFVEDSHYNGSGEVNSIDAVEKVLGDAYKNRNLSDSIGFLLGKNGKVIYHRGGKPVNFQLADYTSRASEDKVGIFEYTVKLQEIVVTEKLSKTCTNPADTGTVRR